MNTRTCAKSASSTAATCTVPRRDWRCLVQLMKSSSLADCLSDATTERPPSAITRTLITVLPSTATAPTQQHSDNSNAIRMKRVGRRSGVAQVLLKRWSERRAEWTEILASRTPPPPPQAEYTAIPTRDRKDSESTRVGLYGAIDDDVENAPEGNPTVRATLWGFTTFTAAPSQCCWGEIVRVKRPWPPSRDRRRKAQR